MKLFYLIPHIGKVMAARTAIAISALSLSIPAISGVGVVGATLPDVKPPAVDTTATMAAAEAPQYAPLNIDTAVQQALTSSYAGDLDRVDPHNGIMRQSYVDMRLPGNGGFDLTILRTYSTSNRINQYSANKSGNGIGWRVDFGRIMVPFWVEGTTNRVDPNPCSATDVVKDNISTYNPILALPGRGYQSLGHAQGSNQYVTSDAIKVYCPNGVNSPFVLTVLTPDGMRYEMTQRSRSNMNDSYVYWPRDRRQNIWHTTKIIDRNGNYANINYKQAEGVEITSVTTNDGRTVDFEYFNSGTDNAKIKSIRSGNVITQYEYDANFVHLKKVTLADNTTYQYDYFPEEVLDTNGAPIGSSFLMKSVTLPTGGIIEYEYTPIWFIERSTTYPLMMTTKRTKRSTGVPDAQWKYDYYGVQPNTPKNTNMPFDYTDEITPTVNNRYYFYRMQSTFTDGDHWVYGLLAKKHIDTLSGTKGNGDVRIELYNWRAEGIHNQFTNGDWFFPIIFSTGYSIKQDGIEYKSTASEFDAYHNATTIVEAGFDASNNSTTSKTTTNTYHLDVDITNNKYDIRKVKTSTSSDGDAVTNAYDGNGNLTSTTKNGVTTQYHYGSDTLLSEIVTPDGLSHFYANYYRGVPQSESHPEGITLYRTVDDVGNILAEADGEQHTTTYTYDGLNRVRSIQLPLGALRTIDYSATQKTIAYGDASEVTSFDGFGRPTSINSNGVITTMTYDAIGRKTFQSDPGSSTGTSFMYDTLNRPIKTVYSDNNFSTVSYGKGSVTTTNERRQGSYRYDYRAYGNPEQKILMAITAPEAAASIAIKRNANDLIESVTQDGVKRTYAYDAKNYLIAVNHPETGTTIFGRDASGNMISKNIEGYLATTYTYDGQNRLKSITYPSGTPSVNYTYSKTGKITSVATNANTRTFAYDENDNLKLESLTIDDITFTTGYTYNAMNALSSITLPRDVKTIDYAPDVFGRPTKVSGFVNNITYWPSGNVNKISYVNGVESIYEQNSRLWPASFTTKKGSQTFIQSNYTYDEVGNLFTVRDEGNPKYDRWLKYDNLDRLTTANGSWGNGAISYDGKGNIIQQNVDGNVLNYKYDASNRLYNISGYRTATFGYDINGNITSGTDAYTYNYASQLTCVNCTIPSKKIEYQYDGQNQRVATIKADVKTYEIYDASGKLILEFTPSLNNKMVKHIYLNGKRIAQSVSNQ